VIVVQIAKTGANIFILRTEAKILAILNEL